MTTIQRKLFGEWGGVDFRSNAKSRQPRFCTELENARPLLDGSWGARNGIKAKAANNGGIGMKSYVYVDTDGERQEELLVIDEEMYRYTEGVVTIRYVGSGDSAGIFIGPSVEVEDIEGGDASIYDSVTSELLNSYTFDLYVEGEYVSSPGLSTYGNGVISAPEAGGDSVSTVVATINALADWVCTATGDTSVGMWALPHTNEALTPGVNLEISYGYWVKVYCPTTTPFSDAWGAVNNDNFELASMLNHANRLWIATGYNHLYKYDGVSLFRAGMPAATAYSNATTGVGTVPAGTYECFITYEQIDALGNSVEGNPSNYDSVTASGADQIRHTLPNLQTSSRFLTSCAIKNGAQSGVTTLTVDASHTLQVGQTAYFFDGATSAYVEREITARTNTSITIAGANVNVADNAVISANLRINIWRPILGASIAYLVASVPNDSIGASTQTYDDNTSDATLLASAEYETPLVGHDEPPENLRYLTGYQNLLIGGTPSSDEISHSDIDGPEYWVDSFRVRSKSNEPITGVGANKEVLAVFKKDETHVVVGDLASQQYRNEMLSDGIGCDSHHSIIDVEGALWFWNSEYGPKRLVSTSRLDDVGYRLMPEVSERGLFTDSTFVHKRTVAVVHKALQLALFFVPTEETLSSGIVVVPTEASRVFVADYSKQYDFDRIYDAEGRLKLEIPKVYWWPWTNMDFACGATLFNGDLLIGQRTYSEASVLADEPTCVLSVFSEDRSELDYTDHGWQIHLLYASGWDDLEAPDTFKKWIQARIYSFPSILSLPFSLSASLELAFNEGSSLARKVIDFGSTSAWNSFLWGTDSWGESITLKKTFPFRPNRATAARLVFRCDAYRQFPVVSGWDIDVVPTYSPEGKDDS